jgi:hypothetical protein
MSNNEKTVTVTVPAKGMRPEATAAKAVNAGPLRGNNTFPVQSKFGAKDSSRTGRTADEADRSGPGGRYGKGSKFEAASDTAAKK